MTMTSLSTADFDAFFFAVHGQEPFPWQRRLCKQVLNEGWPRVLQLPTASGKTAVMDVAVFALAAGAPAARRRVAFVVDRRVVVDEASERARKLAAALARAGNGEGIVGSVATRLRAIGGSDVPLITATLRGGVLRDDAWARSPAQPVLVCATVDQVGSRLLFRGYGCGSARSWPIHAGLLGVGTLLIVDEAHCSRPFCDTALAIVERYGKWAEVGVGVPLALMRMSATVGEEADFGLDEDDYRDPQLARRLGASKPAVLELVEAGQGQEPRAAIIETIVDIAARLASEAPRLIGVVVNRVATARAAFDALPVPEGRKLLLTGRVRGWERDQLLERWKENLAANPDRSATAESGVAVATQCIEVGANLDFDALVTECAALDALRQRFGRLNRLGRLVSAPAYVVAEVSQVKEGADDDPIYAGALARTWRWLDCVAVGGPNGRVVDFGVDALKPLLPPDEELAELCTPSRHAPVLLPAHLDLLVQTSPEPEPSPTPGLFLHGRSAGADDVTIVWRADLDPDRPGTWLDLVAVIPPLAGEGCAVPFAAARAWLSEREAPLAADADVWGAPGDDEASLQGRRIALRWRGVDDSDRVDARDLRPGDTIIVPAGYGGCDGYGWNPASSDPVLDLADAVGVRARARPVLRLRDAVVRTWLRPETDPQGTAGAALTALRGWASGEEEAAPAALLETITETATLPDWARNLCRALARDGRRRVIRVDDHVSIVGSRPVQDADEESESDFSGVDDRSPLTVKVTLERHSLGVRQWAERFVQACGLPEALGDDVALAAWLHDIGKADPRFQVYLCGGDEVAAALEHEPLAKSDLNSRNRAALSRARARAGYPEGGRHEFESLALIEACPALLSGAADPDLVRHLVSSHHGYGRPLPPVIEDRNPVEVRVIHGGTESRAGSGHQFHELDRGVPERFWRLVRRYGWWGLAFLEAVLRLADHRRSEEEQRDRGDA
jgi:CRISPR-associated endonuclease/helicase Cas3